MPHPHRRTWTLGGLDRQTRWLLWFDHDAFRWEVTPETEGVAGGGPDKRSAGAPTAAPVPAGSPPRRRWLR